MFFYFRTDVYICACGPIFIIFYLYVLYYILCTVTIIYVFTYDPHLILFINLILNGYHLIYVVICKMSLSIIQCDFKWNLAIC